MKKAVCFFELNRTAFYLDRFSKNCGFENYIPQILKLFIFGEF